MKPRGEVSPMQLAPQPSTPSSASLRSNSPSFRAQYSSDSTQSPSAYTVSTQSSIQKDDTEKQEKAENVWKHIFDYFDYFQDRAADTETIDKRLADIRSRIPILVSDILNTNFTAVSSLMNEEISKSMHTPTDYSNLFEAEYKNYIDQLCYLYWMVEDVINRIGYVESLYPSTRLLKLNEPSYASNDFEATSKTLLLWYKIMTELMKTCDVMGRFLGFARRQEHLQYWTWFDQRQGYSRQEYDKIQSWLNSNLQTKPSYSKTPSLVSSPIITYVKPSFSQSQTSNSQLKQQKSMKHSRQISYELRIPKTSDESNVPVYSQSPSIVIDNSDEYRHFLVSDTSACSDFSMSICEKVREINFNLKYSSNSVSVFISCYMSFFVHTNPDSLYLIVSPMIQEIESC